MDLVHLYFLKMHSFLEKYNRRLKLNVNSQNTEFEVITKIREETFSNDIPLLDLVQSENFKIKFGGIGLCNFFKRCL